MNNVVELKPDTSDLPDLGSIRDLGLRMEKLHRRQVDLRARRVEIENAPLTRDDFIEGWRKRIDYKAGMFEKELRASLTKTPMRWDQFKVAGDRGGDDSRARDQFLMNPFVPGLGGMNTVPIDAAYFYQRAELIAGLAKIADGMTWPDTAILVADRPGLLSAVDAELSSNEAEQQKIGAWLSDAGLALSSF